ncbi:MAG: hypothetical protein GY696_09610 [Gammaproteobacteria bacterium]|nr:hypothetical protein [Gammaproteobacteria bacterium]
MNAISFFTLEVTLSISISLTIITLLKPLLSDLLTDTCGTTSRAAFWVMFTQLMLVISPLLIVIFFASTDPVSSTNAADAIKETLFRTLLGIFIALITVGQVIWRSITAQDGQGILDNHHEAP